MFREILEDSIDIERRLEYRLEVLSIPKAAGSDDIFGIIFRIEAYHHEVQ